VLASPPTPAQCAPTYAHRSLPAIIAPDRRPGAIRVFAMQYEQLPQAATTAASFARRIECLLIRYVVPHRSRKEPNVVVFNEDVGLVTAATGSRGAAARAVATSPLVPSCEPQGIPCRTLATIAALDAGYAIPLAYYRVKFPAMGVLSQAFVATTDTQVRSFVDTFGDLARRYGIYLLASADLPPYRESSNPLDVAALADPDGARASRPKSVYVATSAAVHNRAFLWAPDGNVVRTNDKVPLTSIENELGLTPGPATGPQAIANLTPYAIPHTKARLGIATSLPAFAYGPATTTDPCANVAVTYMRCLDRLGANVVLQDEANPGRWAGAGSQDPWQPLEWMTSTWRAVSDPSVRFLYNVTPMMVGNLADLAFDGQSAITQRGATRGPGCQYVGDAAQQAEDPAAFAPDAGPKRQFVAMAPWVMPDGPRAQLRATGAALAPGSGSPLEDDYLETALIADLTFPVDRRRAGCVSAPTISRSGNLHRIRPR
jgi:hypothetical protein